jgi:hypothetical protein
MARGGKREGAGRKPIAEELKARDTFLKAIKEFYKKETCEEAQIQFIKDTLMESQRGQIFIAEHIFGKPEEKVNNTHSFNEFSIKDVITFKENVSDK